METACRQSLNYANWDKILDIKVHTKQTKTQTYMSVKNNNLLISNPSIPNIKLNNN